MILFLKIIVFFTIIFCPLSTSTHVPWHIIVWYTHKHTLKDSSFINSTTVKVEKCLILDFDFNCFIPPQVITIDLRSTQFCGGLGISVPEHVDVSIKNKATGSEVPYVKMLNRVLPQDIRILDWSPAAEGFSARFDCKSRTYRYYFPRGSLDVTLMAEAAKRWLKTHKLWMLMLPLNVTVLIWWFVNPDRYEGTHDFRNLCKMDVGNGVLQFERTILSASVKPVQPQDISSTGPYDVFIFEIKGLAFLYHQVWRHTDQWFFFP